MSGSAWLECHAQSDWRAAHAVVEDAERNGPGVEGEWPGCCGLCGYRGHFRLDASPSGFREGLPCARCRCNARQRAAAMVLLRDLPQPQAARVYCTEQASALFLALRRRVANLAGSEFTRGLFNRMRLTAWLWRHGCAVGVVRHEDVAALSWPSATMDGVVSLDVLEHVHDYARALREFHRVLKPGGVLVLTIPFYDYNAASETIAHVGADGEIRFEGEPEMHGDPLGKGIPCFHHFGWDVLESIRQAGFSEASALHVRAPDKGLPKGIWVLRARR